MSYQSVLDYWFEPEKSSRWFGGGAVVDAEIKEKFGEMILKARNGEYESWGNLEEGDKAGLAFIILLDQFCRNIYRGTPDMYSHDSKSLATALKIIEKGTYKKMNDVERFFLYLPLEHDENLEIQNKCVELYGELVEEFKDSKVASQGVTFSKLHQAQIVKYGRFPKRNRILGRENTPQEEEDLKDWKDFF